MRICEARARASKGLRTRRKSSEFAGGRMVMPKIRPTAPAANRRDAKESVSTSW